MPIPARLLLTRRGWLFRQPERALAHDVALDLAGAREDGAGAGRQECLLPPSESQAAAGGGAVVGVGRVDRLVVVVRGARPDHAVGTQDLHGDLAEPLVVLGPEELAAARLRTRFLPGSQVRQQAQ